MQADAHRASQPPRLADQRAEEIGRLVRALCATRGCLLMTRRPSFAHELVPRFNIRPRNTSRSASRQIFPSGNAQGANAISCSSVTSSGNSRNGSTSYPALCGVGIDFTVICLFASLSESAKDFAKHSASPALMRQFSSSVRYRCGSNSNGFKLRVDFAQCRRRRFNHRTYFANKIISKQLH